MRGLMPLLQWFINLCSYGTSCKNPTFTAKAVLKWEKLWSPKQQPLPDLSELVFILRVNIGPSFAAPSVLKASGVSCPFPPLQLR